jgi:hypothetical protein
MHRTTARAAAVLTLAGLLLAGCIGKNPGEVVSRERDTRYERDRVCVRYDGGGIGCGPVDAEVYDNCRVGVRWPDCKTTPLGLRVRPGVSR